MLDLISLMMNEILIDELTALRTRVITLSIFGNLTFHTMSVLQLIKVGANKAD